MSTQKLTDGTHLYKPEVHLDRQEVARASRKLEKMISKYSQRFGVERVIMTPALARALLERNKDNRPFKPVQIAMYEADMVHDDFKGLNGQTIVVSKEGLLNDGQNRAVATINADAKYETLMVFGAERESRLTLDNGAVRTAGNYLAMKGIEYATSMATMSKLMLQYHADPEKGLFRWNNTNIYNAVTKVRISEEAEANEPEYVEAIKFVWNGDHNVLAPPATLALAYIITKRKAMNEKHATEFAAQVVFGENLSRDDPALTLRHRLMQAKSGPTSNRLRAGQVVELYLRAWNAYRKGEPVKSLRTLGKCPEVHT